MPYITQSNRAVLEPSIDPLLKKFLSAEPALSEGDLNYIITTLIHTHLNRVGTNYKNINAMIGVLECAKLELYRRIASPYEDKKIAENGDV